MPAVRAKPVTLAEAESLFSELVDTPVLILAVSGGPDSTALMVLAARWRDTLAKKPTLIAVTIDHGLRAESKGEAADVGRLARKLGMAHRVLRWSGRKPKTGVQEAARAARYRLLAKAAREAGASFILTAHTLDDQAETVLIRLTRGSGLTGLGGMQKISVIPGCEPEARLRASATRYGKRDATLYLLRPLLDIPKARLIATLRAAKIPFVDDPSNRDPRFTRARLRKLMPALAEEGLSASRFARLAGRLRQADRALETTVDESFAASVQRKDRGLTIDAAAFAKLSGEIGLRLLARMFAPVAESPVKLGKLEGLKEALDAAVGAGDGRFRRSLAGAMVTLRRGEISVERAPPRRDGKVTRGKKRSV